MSVIPFNPKFFNNVAKLIDKLKKTRLTMVMVALTLVVSFFGFPGDNLTPKTSLAASIHMASLPPRGGHAMVYDSANEKGILFGGTSAAIQALDDTWAYDYSINAWIALNPAGTPSARSAHAMAYDSMNQKTVLFGGMNAETWIYDYLSNSWNQVFPETQPPSKDSHAMVYDAVSQKVILFGGFTEGKAGDDFWAYDYLTNTWTELNPTLKPLARYGHTMVYDSTNQKVILFGGNSRTGYKDDTWAYDYPTNTWTEMNSASHPVGRKWATMSYDSVNQKIILFGGGSGGESSCSDDTWVYDYSLNQWEIAYSSVAPPCRFLTASVFDSVNQKVILVQGIWDQEFLEDTWAFDFNDNTWTSKSAAFIVTAATSTIHSSSAILPSQSTDFLTFEALVFPLGVMRIFFFNKGSQIRKKRMNK